MVFKRRDKPPFSTRLREALLPRRGWRRGVEYLGHRRAPAARHARTASRSASPAASSARSRRSSACTLFAAVIAAPGCPRQHVAALIGTGVGNPLTFPLIAPVALGARPPHPRPRRQRPRLRAGSRTPSPRPSTASARGHAQPVRPRRQRTGASSIPFFRDMLWPYLVGGLLPGLIAAVAELLPDPAAGRRLPERGGGRGCSTRAHERLAAADGARGRAARAAGRSPAPQAETDDMTRPPRRASGSA